MGRRPWFPFYVDDFWADESVASMTFEEVGVYLRLLSLQWREGSIPADHEKLARICGLDGVAMATLMGSVGPCFEIDPADKSRLVNPRLKTVSDKASAATKKQSDAGKTGAKRRWRPHADPNGGAITTLSQNDGEVIAKRESELKEKQDPPLPPQGGEAPEDLKISDLEDGGQGKAPGKPDKGSKPKSGRRKEKTLPTPPPEDFKPSKLDIEWFRKNVGSVSKKRVDLETQNFLTHHSRKGNEFVDWNQAWKNWMIREAKSGGWADKGKGATGRDGDYPDKAPGLVEED